MKKIEATYKIELTPAEIEIITTALHGEYKTLKTTAAESIDESRRIYERMQPIKELRNDFANLINKTYMGEDA